jgi:hypothetical protein
MFIESGEIMTNNDEREAWEQGFKEFFEHAGIWNEAIARRTWIAALEWQAASQPPAALEIELRRLSQDADEKRRAEENPNLERIWLGMRDAYDIAANMAAKCARSTGQEPCAMDFETWASDPVRADKLPLEKHPNGAYKDMRTYLIRYGWNSALKHGRPDQQIAAGQEPVGEMIESLFDGTAVPCVDPQKHPLPVGAKLYAAPIADNRAGVEKAQWTMRYQSARRFRHLKSGGTYRLVCYANMESDCAPAAVYESEDETGRVWVRPYAEFFDGRFEEIESVALADLKIPASQPAESNQTPFANCQFRICDLPGQCRAEGECHHPVAQPAESKRVDLDAKDAAELFHLCECYRKDLSNYRHRSYAEILRFVVGLLARAAPDKEKGDAE